MCIRDSSMISSIRSLTKAFSTQQKSLLFTPGPLGISQRVRQSMDYDYGSREPRFIQKVKYVREQLLNIAHVSPKDYTTILMQGAGTFGVEATIITALPKQNYKLLIASNGAYGERMHKICKYYGLNHEVVRFQENEVVDPKQLEQHLKKDKEITHVALIHSETTTGLINPIQQLGQACLLYTSPSPRDS
eukprot:TRINITY_DN2021_c0_g1_i1.p1 TRINITY_DN2021_c0_g1~~TRINITY_DN2021_c0_g1_i1.p1  ORF type:complete len:190 (+),score=41.24 TRINITY_DN2021_c0_g1_i1:62-631(+)